MKLKAKAWVLCVLWIPLVIPELKAQIIPNAIIGNPGLQVGLNQGFTSQQDEGLNYSFRLYNQHEFDKYRFGELSISSVVVSGLSYRSQLTPVEYRLGYDLSPYGMPELSVLGARGTLYGYGGLGIVYNRPLSIIAPNDPLTQEMGNSLPSSSFWDFKGGIAPFIPIGVGMKIRMEEGTNLVINTGYNQILRSLKMNSGDLPIGFWGISIGLNFKRKYQKRTQVQFVQAPALNSIAIKNLVAPPIEQMEPEVAEVKPVDMTKSILEKINGKQINFDILSSSLDKQGNEWLNEVALMLKMTPALNLEVFGHADSVGATEVNEMISESRARAVWLQLIKSGVKPSRINYNWFADQRPVSSNQSRAGRSKNRRVEFRSVEVHSDKPDLSIAAQGDELLPKFQNITNGKPLLKYYDIFFSEGMLKLSGNSLLLIKEVAKLMHRRPEMDLLLLMQVDQLAGEELQISLAKARAELLKAELIIEGIEHHRIKLIDEYSTLYDKYNYLLTKTTQQNYLIPELSIKDSREELED